MKNTKSNIKSSYLITGDFSMSFTSWRDWLVLFSSSLAWDFIICLILPVLGCVPVQEDEKSFEILLMLCDIDSTWFKRGSFSTCWYCILAPPGASLHFYFQSPLRRGNFRPIHTRISRGGGHCHAFSRVFHTMRVVGCIQRRWEHTIVAANSSTIPCIAIPSSQGYKELRDLADSNRGTAMMISVCTFAAWRMWIFNVHLLLWSTKLSQYYTQP